MEIVLIIAVADNGVIGADGRRLHSRDGTCHGGGPPY